jgi:SAM-dependent methyltransferase
MSAAPKLPAMISPPSLRIEELYRARFGVDRLASKDAVWSVLCENFLSRFIKPTDRVLDVGAGYCEFINHIRCGEKFAYDLNPDTTRFAACDVRLVLGDCRDMSALEPGSFDVAFVSNFFEHLESKRDMDRVLTEIFERLRPTGRLLIFQPNLRYVGARYWDFYDHVLPLTHESMREGLLKNGFQIETLIPRFLPYTFKSKLPTYEWLVRLYLKVPFAWQLLGKQMFIVAVRPEVTPDMQGGR